MEVEGKYKIVKDIPLDRNGEKCIKAGTALYFVHGVFYFDSGIVSADYQGEFFDLLDYELKNGWNYLQPDRMSNPGSMVEKYYND